MLRHIQSLLEKEQLECSLVNGTEQSPTDHLLVFLGVDPNTNQEQILEITAQEQALDTKPTKSHSKEYFRIQFHYFFPFPIDDLALNQVGSLLHFLNQTLDFPGLELNELENRISYRYVWLTKGNHIDSTLLICIISVIKFILTLFSGSIERLATGKTTFNELLKEIIEIAAQNMQKNS